MSSQQSSLHWFEKTVEYAFVIKHALHLADAIPLAGNHEKAGDAIFNIAGARWVLIEFKRAQGNLDTEYGKYSDYDVAEAALHHCGDRLHFFIYGEIDGKQLTLKAAKYWQRTPLTSIDSLLQGEGTDSPVEFQAYLSEVVARKKDGGGGGGGGGGGVDFSVVAAVGADGKVRAVAPSSEVSGPTNEHSPGSATRPSR